MAASRYIPHEVFVRDLCEVLTLGSTRPTAGRLEAHWCLAPHNDPTKKNGVSISQRSSSCGALFLLCKVANNLPCQGIPQVSFVYAPRTAGVASDADWQTSLLPTRRDKSRKISSARASWICDAGMLGQRSGSSRVKTGVPSGRVANLKSANNEGASTRNKLNNAPQEVPSLTLAQTHAPQSQIA
jgi:hypothetical protein